MVKYIKDGEGAEAVEALVKTVDGAVTVFNNVVSDPTSTSKQKDGSVTDQSTVNQTCPLLHANTRASA